MCKSFCLHEDIQSTSKTKLFWSLNYNTILYNLITQTRSHKNIVSQIPDSLQVFSSNYDVQQCTAKHKWHTLLILCVSDVWHGTVLAIVAAVISYRQTWSTDSAPSLVLPCGKSRWVVEHSNSRFESIRFDSLSESIRIDSFSEKNRHFEFRFTSCHAVFALNK